jgi:hypothetical protein
MRRLFLSFILHLLLCQCFLPGLCRTGAKQGVVSVLEFCLKIQARLVLAGPAPKIGTPCNWANFS